MRALSIFQRLQPDDPPLDSLSLIAHWGTSLPFSFPIRRSINVDKSDERNLILLIIYRADPAVPF